MKHIITIQFEIEGGAELTEVLKAIPPERWDATVQETAQLLWYPGSGITKIAYKSRVDKLHPSPVPRGSWLYTFFWKLWKRLKGEYQA